MKTFQALMLLAALAVTACTDAPSEGPLDAPPGDAAPLLGKAEQELQIDWTNETTSFSFDLNAVIPTAGLFEVWWWAGTVVAASDPTSLQVTLHCVDQTGNNSGTDYASYPTISPAMPADAIGFGSSSSGHFTVSHAYNARFDFDVDILGPGTGLEYAIQMAWHYIP